MALAAKVLIARLMRDLRNGNPGRRTGVGRGSCTTRCGDWPIPLCDPGPRFEIRCATVNRHETARLMPALGTWKKRCPLAGHLLLILVRGFAFEPADDRVLDKGCIRKEGTKACCTPSAISKVTLSRSPKR